MGDRRDLPAAVEREITKRYMSGERAGKLAAEYGINRKTITTIVKRQGGDTSNRTAGAPRFPDSEWAGRVLALRAEGLSQTQVGDRLGMSQAVVSRILRGAGQPARLQRRGASASNWKGGRSLKGDGYVLISTDEFPSMLNRTGYVLEHRLVMARALRRPLASHETVHHINGDRADNRIENLQLRQGRHGRGIALRCSDCGSTHVEPYELQED